MTQINNVKYAGFIYEWTNIITGEKYIGSHKGTINDGYIGSGDRFNDAIKKYGLPNFKREILETIEQEDLILIREQYYLNLLNKVPNENNL